MVVGGSEDGRRHNSCRSHPGRTTSVRVDDRRAKRTTPECRVVRSQSIDIDRSDAWAERPPRRRELALTMLMMKMSHPNRIEVANDARGCRRAVVGGGKTLLAGKRVVQFSPRVLLSRGRVDAKPNGYGFVAPFAHEFRDEPELSERQTNRGGYAQCACPRCSLFQRL
jgi:hypothetical protein